MRYSKLSGLITSALVSDQGHIHEVLSHEPDLQFVGADDIAHNEIICAVVAFFTRLLCGGMGLQEDDFVSLKEP